MDMVFVPVLENQLDDDQDNYTSCYWEGLCFIMVLLTLDIIMCVFLIRRLICDSSSMKIASVALSLGFILSITIVKR